MNKNAQILLGVAVLATGGYFYWKSTQTTKLNATGGATKKKHKKRNFGGDVKAVPNNFFKPQGSVDAINNFKNADGYTRTAKPEKFTNADGGIMSLFKHTPNGFIKTHKEKTFANAEGVFGASSNSQVFANMIPTMATYNSGNSFM